MGEGHTLSCIDNRETDRQTHGQTDSWERVIYIIMYRQQRDRETDRQSDSGFRVIYIIMYRQQGLRGVYKSYAESLYGIFNFFL